MQNCFDTLYREYRSSFIRTDPIVFVTHYKERNDKEVVAFIASAFAYGNVSQIQKNLSFLLTPLTKTPSVFLASTNIPQLVKSCFSSWKYRFQKPEDLESFFFGIQNILKKYGSFENLFLKGYSEKDFKKSLENFIERFHQEIPSSMKPIDFLLPSPAKGSACKRLNLFLRWMVRKDDIDFGLWENISPAKLYFPVDTHILQITGDIGIHSTQGKSATWKSVEVITRYFRNLDPEDPVKYDFALTRLGMLKKCILPQKACSLCLLEQYCKKHTISGF